AHGREQHHHRGYRRHPGPRGHGPGGGLHGVTLFAPLDILVSERENRQRERQMVLCRAAIGPVLKIPRPGACALSALAWGCPFPVFAPWGSPCSSARCFWWPWGFRYYVAETGGKGNENRHRRPAQRCGGHAAAQAVRHPQGGGAVKQETTYRQGRERLSRLSLCHFANPAGLPFSGDRKSVV